MTIRFCVILIGLCNQVSSLIFGSRFKFVLKYFLLQVGTLLAESFGPFGLFCPSMFYLVGYSIIRDSLFYDHVAF